MAKKNIYPVDWQYQLPEQLLSVLDEYHILKVPLLGQHYENGPPDWCGRTSCSMAYNYYQVVQGGDFKSRFITHWDGGKSGQFVDLRYPGGQRAFHTLPTQPPHNVNLKGYAVSNSNYKGGDVATVIPPKDLAYDSSDPLQTPDFSASRVLGFSRGELLPYNLDNRKALATHIANDPRLIESRLATVLKAVTTNNPVIFYSGFSATRDAPIHLILIIGYAYLTDSSGRHLWLVVADPATQGNKVGDKKGAHIFFPPDFANKQGHDLDALRGGKLAGEHDLIRVIPGAWNDAKASLVLIRARKLFEENIYSTVRNDLFMDYFHDLNKGGTFIYSHRQTPVPSEFVSTNVMRSVAYPCDGVKARFRPANCYELTEQAAAGLFPLGMRRNLHSGIHLESSLFASQAVAGSSSSVERAVRCFAPGYVVAVRLTNALPEPIREVKKQEPAQGKARQGPAEQREATPDELAREFTGNHNSFVLVRHDVEEVIKDEPSGETGSKAKKKAPKRFTFYSLYMHLVPPKWEADPDTYRNVGWLKTFAGRHGSLTVLEPRSEFFRKSRWLQKPPAVGAAAQAKEPEVVAQVSGAFSLIGDGLGKPVELKLGAEQGDEQEELIRAVWKKPQRDLTSLLEELSAGKVVTLRHPYLKLGAGELVGYVDARSQAAGEGFLHWEILGPSGSGQLEEFLEFAEQKLGLSGFFKRFKEEEQNNFFDPEKDELVSLMDLAPVSKRAGEEASGKVERFRRSYDHGALRQILQSPRALAFSSDDAQGSEPARQSGGFEEAHEPSYPVELVITNFKNALPAASVPYELKITFEPDTLPPLLVKYDGKQTRLPLRLPAKARRIFVEPADPSKVLLQPGGGSDDALRKDIEHFKQLASVRWRNVVLEHLNEWMPDSIVTQVLEHLEIHKELGFGDDIVEARDKEHAKKILGKYAAAVGWWAHEDEVSFLGPKAGEEDKKKLFADQPDAEQLPRNGLIDNPHPVTFTWLLMLLSRHNLIRFVDTPLWQSEEMKKLLAVGWLPARTSNPSPRRVGESVYIAALVRGSGEEPVTVHVKRGETTLTIASGKCFDGAFIESAEVPGWGEWTLHEPGAQALGGLTLEGLRPQFLGGRESPDAPGSQVAETFLAPESHGDGTFSWRLSFRENCPKLLRGWIVMRSARLPTKKDKKAPPAEPRFTLADVAIPVQAREDMAFNESAGFVVVDGFIQKGTIKDVNTYVTQHFTYKQYLDAAPKPQENPKLAWELAEAVERIRSGYAARQPVTLLGLSEDGLSLQLRASNVESLRTVVAKAKEDGWIEHYEDAGKREILIRVPMPEKSHHPGQLVVEFDANAAFTELRKGVPEGEEVHVRFGCFFPNGGAVLDSDLLPKDTLGTRYAPVTLDELKSKARFGYLELWSTTVAHVLHSPMFEAPQVTVTDKGLRVSARLLGGNSQFWTAAGPMIKIGVAALDVDARKQSELQNGCVVRTLSFSDSNLKGRFLEFSAVAQNKRVPLGPERIDVQPVQGPAYSMQRDASIETRRRADNPFLMTVSLVTSAVPLNRGFKLELASAKGSPALTLKKSTIRYKPDRGGFGVTGVDGVFHAEVDVSDVAAALAGGKEYELRVVPRDEKADKDLARQVMLSVYEEYHQRAEDEVRLFLDMWEGMDASVPMKGERV